MSTAWLPDKLAKDSDSYSPELGAPATLSAASPQTSRKRRFHRLLLASIGVFFAVSWIFRKCSHVGDLALKIVRLLFLQLAFFLNVHRSILPVLSALVSGQKTEAFASVIMS